MALHKLSIAYISLVESSPFPSVVVSSGSYMKGEEKRCFFCLKFAVWRGKLLNTQTPDGITSARRAHLLQSGHLSPYVCYTSQVRQAGLGQINYGRKCTIARISHLRSLWQQYLAQFLENGQLEPLPPQLV